MKFNRLLAALIALALSIPATSIAQTAAPTYLQGNQIKTADGIFVLDKNGNPLGTTANPLNINGPITITGTPSVTALGVYNTSPAALTNGQPSALQLDANGYLKINVAASTGASLSAVSQSAGGGAANTWTVGGVITLPTATFTTTSATNAWTANQLIANNATAGSVTPLAFTNACRVNGGSGSIRRAQAQVASDTGFAGQSLLLALHTSAPTYTNGDRATWLTTDSGFIGTIAITLSQHFSDQEQGFGTPVNGSEINFTCAAGSTTIYGELISPGTITPQAGSKAIIAGLEVLAN